MYLCLEADLGGLVHFIFNGVSSRFTGRVFFALRALTHKVVGLDFVLVRVQQLLEQIVLQVVV